MLKHSRTRQPVSLSAALVLCLALAACGGDDGGKESTSASTTNGNGSGTGLVCFTLLLISGNSQCLDSQSSTSVNSGTPIVFRLLEEYEPNNDLANAIPVDFPRTTDKDGFIVDGDVHDASDQADAFTFTRAFTRYYAFRLCPNGHRYCNDYGEIDSLTAYIDVLDQSGNVLASTQASNSNYVRLELPGGVANYVRVVAGDTMATTVQYHLVVHEDNN